jgi:metal-responsive CopG/Arc/MetJ family transcriptional regulator
MSHRLQVLIPPDLDAQIDKAAQRNRVSKGEWVRRALKESLRQQTGKGIHANPVARMASLNGPAAGIDQMLAEIEAGRR